MRSMRRLIEDLQEAMTMRDVAQKHAPEELAAQDGGGKVPPGYKMVFGRLVKKRGMNKAAKIIAIGKAMRKGHAKGRRPY
jgi:hypothetical protein